MQERFVPISQGAAKPKSKKVLWVVLGTVLAVVALAIVGLSFWAKNIYKKSSVRIYNKIELPENIDYKKLTSAQQKALIEETAKKYPSALLKASKEELAKSGGVPIFQDVIFTRNRENVDQMAPGKGDVSIEPSDSSDLGEGASDNEKSSGGRAAGATQSATSTPKDKEKSATATTTATPKQSGTPTSGASGKGPTIYYEGYVGGSETQAEITAKLRNIRNLINKYYSKAAEIYGWPYDADNREITIYYDSSAALHYYPQSDSLTLNTDRPVMVLIGLLFAFSGEYSWHMPESWKYGMVYAAAEQILREFPSDGDLDSGWMVKETKADYEKFNVKEFPMWGPRIFYDQDIFPYYEGLIHRVFLASSAMTKLYEYDQQGFAKINQWFYSHGHQPANYSFDMYYAIDEIVKVMPNIDGKPPKEWYKNQHVLDLQDQSMVNIYAKMTLGDGFVAQLTGQGVVVYSYWVAYNYNDDERPIYTKFVGKPQRHIDLITIRDDRDNILWRKQDLISNDNGFYQLNLNELNLPGYNRYTVQIGWWARKFHFDYYGKDEYKDNLHGAVLNFGTGMINVYSQDGSSVEGTGINNGAFTISKPLEGIYKVKITDYQGKTVYEKNFAKDRGGYFALFDTDAKSYPAVQTSPAPTSKSRSSDCSNISVSNWKSYKDGLIKYPSDWEAAEINEGMQEGPTRWVADFTPPSNSVKITLGETAEAIDGFKEYLAQTTPGLTIEKTETSKVGGKNATKLTAKTPGSPYDLYIYYLPTVNTAQVFRGPAASSYFSACEPEIYQAMLGTYLNQFAQDVNQETGESGGGQTTTYINADCKIMFEYPGNWEIKSDEYYETAGGEKAKVPMIVLGKQGGPSNGTNTIAINPRQSSCADLSPTPDRTEPAGGQTVEIYIANDSSTFCVSAQVQGQDKNGKSAIYNFVSFYDDTAVKEIFKQIVGSFKVTQ